MSWTADELARIEAARELKIAPRRRDGTLWRPVRIWVVRAGDDLYVRSWLGTGGSWYRAVLATRQGRIWSGGVERDVTLVDAGEPVNDAVDAAFRAKYRPYRSRYVKPMTEPPARDTTLRLVPVTG